MAADAAGRDALGRALWEATTRRDVAEVVRLLAHDGAPADWRNAAEAICGGNAVSAAVVHARADAQGGKTALIKAAETCGFELLPVLVTAGADLEAKDAVGHNCWFARYQGCTVCYRHRVDGAKASDASPAGECMAWPAHPAAVSGGKLGHELDSDWVQQLEKLGIRCP
ncbi:unnamed protein product [Symbiodinium sp. KB8]|nr:unnamed protein product [Symbiodinium sp. KB8]